MIEADKQTAKPRVCVCVIMNHPYPANLPLLRRIYGQRFSKVVFLIPLARLPDDDVITVYRGSYAHSGYVADARAKLARIDCDYFMFLHDDVLLNPKLDEQTFLSTFPLGPRDGFIPAVGFGEGTIGGWPWYFGLLPKLLYPHSRQFGNGVEAQDLLAHLPNAEQLLAKYVAEGLHHQTSVRLTTDHFEPIAEQASRVLLHGFAAGLRADDRQAQVDRMCLEVAKALVDALLMDKRRRGEVEDDEQKSVRLPFAMIGSAFFTDFYILPKPCLDEFAHYIGVSSAANLFVEIMTPMMLYATCEKVWTAPLLGIDFSGFRGASSATTSLSDFTDPKFIALHPVKLSVLSVAADQDAFLLTLQGLRDDQAWARAPVASLGEQLRRSPLTGDMFLGGWSDVEPWGRWAVKQTAEIAFSHVPGDEISAVKLVLHAPLSVAEPVWTGRVSLNDAPPIELAFDFDSPSLTVVFPADAFAPDGVNRLVIVSDALTDPGEPTSPTADTRTLGLGLTSMEFVAAGSERLLSAARRRLRSVAS